jgi:hypothetical protein
MKKRGEPKTSRKIKREMGVGLANPQRLTDRQVQSLAGSVGAHIEPRRTGQRKSPRGGGRRTSRR